MHSRGVVQLIALVLAAIATPPRIGGAQIGAPQATFRSSVDLVSVSAIVRDKKGRVVRSLTAPDFIVTDAGQPRQIVGLQADNAAPASVALLVDGSGSMRLGPAIALSRQICETVLASLRQVEDRAALLSFDTRLLTHREFTGKFDQIRDGLDEVDAFGSTSLYDAIAGASAKVAKGTRQRRAVIVLTDGSDNTSLTSSQEVASIASTIDVPVYVFAVGELNPVETSDEEGGPAKRNALFELARATGGDYFVTTSPALVHTAATRLLEELRYQYLIAFEPLRATGLRRIEIRARNANLTVRARAWYSPDGTE